jgi:streptomycin 3"-adenylyltransferase
VSIPPPVAEYAAAVDDILRSTVGEILAGLYLHGSGAMGGWHERLSDVDLLGVVARSLTSEEKVAVSRALSSVPAPGAGLEFSLVAKPDLIPLLPRPPFELHVATGVKPKVVDGAGHPGDADLVMHFAVCRERGLAISGPPPHEVFPPVPRRMLLEAFEEELAWGLANAPTRYAILNACRAWAFAEEGRVLSKVEGGEWAIDRGFQPATVTQALAAQRDGDVVIRGAAAEGIVVHVRAVLRAAIDADGDA